MSRQTPRVGFITIGQSPRDDVVPEMLRWVDMAVEPVEVGVLDGLTRDEIDSLRPSDTRPRLVSRLRDGTEVVLRAGWVHERLASSIAALESRDLDAIVLLCTGHFPELPATRVPLVLSQRAVDLGVSGVLGDCATLGVLVPLEAQARAAEDRGSGRPGTRVRASHATPYAEGRFEEAAGELADTDAIVMHCMGYDESMLQRVRETVDVPVLLARRLVASALRQLL